MDSNRKIQSVLNEILRRIKDLEQMIDEVKSDKTRQEYVRPQTNSLASITSQNVYTAALRPIKEAYDDLRSNYPV